MKNKNNNLNENIIKLSEINEWFESKEEIDVEIGLNKVKEAVILIKESKKRLKEIENEFEEIKKEIIDENEKY